jgi:phosphoribosylformylglycinamidine synthase subunit PurL
LKLMACPDLASRRWIWEQYDSQVGADTLQKSGGDAAVVRIHGTQKALAISTDCTPRYCYADPYEGGKQAVAECYRNLSAVGALPLAITNCLNFANPQRPEIMAQIVECLRGMGDACRALDFPIVSGNVSLYNESKATGGGSAILPTPAIGGVGLLDDHSKMSTIGFKAAGQIIFVVGADSMGEQLGQSLWLRHVGEREDGFAPTVDLSVERRTSEALRECVNDGLITSIHDCSDGGILVAVSEMALAGGIGAHVTFDPESQSTYAAQYFGEDQGRFIVTIADESGPEMLGRLRDRNVPFFECGLTGGATIEVLNANDRETFGTIAIPLTALREASDSFFRDWMEG